MIYIIFNIGYTAYVISPHKSNQLNIKSLRVINQKVKAKVKRKRFSEEQIVRVLKRLAAGKKVKDL